MLRKLRIENLAVVESASLSFGPGLNVLTGSTGAGKSLILGAVNILLGQRVLAGTVRQGSDRAVVEAVFHLRGPLQADIVSGATGERIKVRREVHAAGRSYSYVNDRPCTLKQLSEVTQSLIEPHGQNEQLQLRHAENHVVILDRLAENSAEVGRFQEALGAFRDAVAHLEEFDRRVRLLKEKQELIEHRLQEVERAQIRQGEKVELEDAVRVMTNANDIFRALDEATAQIYEQDASAVNQVAQARKAIERLVSVDSRFESFAASLREVEVSLDEVAGALRDYGDGLEFDPARLADMEDRLGYLRGLERRYGMTTDELLAQAEEWRSQLDSLSVEGDERRSLEDIRAKKRTTVTTAAKKLTASRQVAAHKLDQWLTSQLGDLMMKGASFRVNIKPEWDDNGELKLDGRRVRLRPDGIDDVSFYVRTNPGEAEGPLADIASSGELSRIALALKSIVNAGREGAVLIFDELDAGIGADLGEMLAHKLVDLAARDQIVCITHMPQIAAAGSRQLVVRKESDGDRTYTRVFPVDGEERRLELARMLGGSEGSEKRLALAAEMLQTTARKTSRSVRP